MIMDIDTSDYINALVEESDRVMIDEVEPEYIKQLYYQVRAIECLELAQGNTHALVFSPSKRLHKLYLERTGESLLFTT